MNLLTDTLPASVVVDGARYKIKTDYRHSLRTILAYEDSELTGYEKQLVLLSNLYITIPRNTAAAIEQGQLFLNGGDPITATEAAPRLYSFSKDSRYIFSAFKQTHHVDLSTVELHWWVFLSLFMDLGSSTAFCNLVTLRDRVKSGKASKEERAAARKLGELFDVPEADTRSAEEKQRDAEFMRLVNIGKQRRRDVP